MRIESAVGMALETWERLKVEEAKVQQLTAATQQRDQQIAERDQHIAQLNARIGHLEAEANAAGGAQ